MAPPSALRAATFPSLRDREDHYVPTGRLLPLPLSIRVERSRDTRRSCAKPDGHLDFARSERMGWATATSGRMPPFKCYAQRPQRSRRRKPPSLRSLRESYAKPPTRQRQLPVTQIGSRAVRDREIKSV